MRLFRTAGTIRSRPGAPPRTRRGLAGVVGAVMAATTLAGCGTGKEASVVGKPALVIGVKPDVPGLGLRLPDGTFEGFDVDVARYVARKLGFSDKDVTFAATPSKDREQALQQRRVDLVVATYSITAERKQKVTFAGPYYVAHQDTLVRAADTAAIRNVRDLRGRKLCKVPGSVSWHRVTEERRIPAVLVEAADYGDCVDRLIGGSVDAVSTDDVILAGLAARRGEQVKIINAPISDERMGIGLPKGDVDGCEAINTALTQMYQDGTARKLLNTWFGATTLRFTTSVPQFEGCG